MGTESSDVQTLLTRYRGAAEGTADPDPKIANRRARDLRRWYLQLRESQPGRNAILALLTDPSPHVRVWAAAHSLEWSQAAARRTLEVLRDSGGACSFDAEMTLREFDLGRLSF